MKTIETSKGKFEIIEMVGEENAMRLTCDIISGNVYYKLSEINEQQASEIVDLHDVQFSYKTLYKLYDIGIRKWCESAKSSLNSLLNSHNIEIAPNTYIFKL